MNILSEKRDFLQHIEFNFCFKYVRSFHDFTRNRENPLSGVRVIHSTSSPDTATMASGTSAQQNVPSEAPEEDAAELQFPKGKNILVDFCWIIIYNS